MSLILDALRKTELELKAKRHGGIDLRPEVLSYRGMQQKGSHRRLLLLVVGGLFLIIVIAAVIFMQRGGNGSLTKAALPEPPRNSAAESPSTPLPLTEPIKTLPAPAGNEINRPDTAKVGSLQPRLVSTTVVGADDITISGIAWQDERSLRRAVINGSLVAEGAEILGARVMEIKESRVKFSRNGQLFELLYPSVKGK